MLISILNLCGQNQLNYLFNQLKFVTSLSLDQYERFPTGTTGNEANHHKLNAAAKETTSRYQNNLDLWLQIMRLRFNIYHDKAASTGFLFREFRTQELLMQVMPGFDLFANPKWDEYAKGFLAENEGDGPDSCFKAVKLPRHDKHKDHAFKFELWKATKQTSRKTKKLKLKRRAGSVSGATVKQQFMSRQNSNGDQL